MSDLIRRLAAAAESNEDLERNPHANPAHADLLRDAIAEIERLAAIVEKYPLLGDGVRFAPGMDIWRVDDASRQLVHAESPLIDAGGFIARDAGRAFLHASRWFSTRDAALAAA